MVLSNRHLSPVIAPEIDQHAHQPRLLAGGIDWNGCGRARNPEEGLLHEIPRSIRGGHETPSQAVQTIVMRIEERREPVGRLTGQADSQEVDHWQPAHNVVNVSALDYVGAIRLGECESSASRMRTRILYVVGFCAVAYGFYEFWHDDIVDQNALLVGSVCIAAAAGLGIIADVWRRLRR